MEEKIYFDNTATTRVDDKVIEAMLPCFRENYGNASSIHLFGVNAKNELNKARTQIASLLGAEPNEIIFTSGGTESNNIALKGIAFANIKKGNHIIVSQIEHDCILETCKWLERQGFAITYLPVDNEGFINLIQLENTIREDTILVSIMHANNEIGTIQPIEAIGQICKRNNVYFHTDACQSFGKLPINVNSMNIDLMTINSHKIYGPKGVGALFVRTGVKLASWQHGGGQEQGLRSATENIPGIVGFAKAAELSINEVATETNRLTELRDKIINFILKEINYSYLNGPLQKRLPNNINVGFHGFEGDAIRLLLALDKMGIAVSTGSACSSNKKSSHVLKAIGLNPVEAIGALRITLGRFNTEQEVDYFLKVLPEALGSIKSIWS